MNFGLFSLFNGDSRATVVWTEIRSGYSLGLVDDFSHDP